MFSLLTVCDLLFVIIITDYEALAYKKHENDNKWIAPYTSASKLGIYPKAAVAADTKPCSAIGSEILKHNGSAVDSAIATLICMGVANPQSSGIGGGFIMTIYNRKERKAETLVAREVAPLRATADMFQGNSILSQKGGLAIAVPGELKGYEEAHSKYGKLSWSALFQSSIKLAENGFTVGFHLANALEDNRDIILNDVSLRSVFVNNETNDLYKEGEKMRRPDIAKTLQIIAKEGTKVLYGNTSSARTMVKEIRDNGGILTLEDLMSYRPVWKESLKIKLNSSLELYSPPPPGSGAVLSYIMSILDGYNYENGMRWKIKNVAALAYHRIVEAFKFAFAKKMELEDSDDPEIKKLVEELTSEEFAEETRKRVNGGRTYSSLSHYDLKMYETEDHGTAHLSILAPNGDAVSVTTSINLHFGSKHRSPTTGIIFNSHMDDFSSNMTNYFGLPPTKRNHIKPGRWPMSSMCPTVIVDGRGDVKMVIGASGGPHIITAVSQVAMKALWMDVNIKEAVDSPRLHHQLYPNILYAEDKFPEKILRKLKWMLHKVSRNPNGKSIVGAIVRAENGKIYANADYRKGGTTDGF